MAAKRAKSEDPAAEIAPPGAPPPAAAAGAGSGAAVVALALVVAALFGGAWYVLWNGVGNWRGVAAQVRGAPQYWLAIDNVTITPPPPWVRADIRREAFRDASLDFPLSVLDADLTGRIYDAFLLHPWVAEVRRVQKHHPASVTVDLVYRRPACMVVVPGGLLPVDATGVLLPSADFSPVEAGRFPRLVGVDTLPRASAGSPWGDARVAGAAQIAAAFGPAWQELGLQRIAASTIVEIGGADPNTFEIYTARATRIFWGRADDASAEGPAADKIARLKQLLAERGSLDGAAGPQQIDLRTPGRVQLSPRLDAAEPSAESQG